MRSDLAKKLSTLREAGTIVLLLAVVLAAWTKDHHFLEAKNLNSILLWIPLLAVVGMGQMLVILTRGIDVSVGSTMGLAGIIVGMLFRDHAGLNVFVGAGIGLAIGAVLGAFNGGLIAWLKIPPIIATLGTLSAYRGLVFIVSKGDQVASNDIPDALVNWTMNGPIKVGGVTVPWLLVWAVVASIITAYLLKQTRTGRDIFSIGSNPDAAMLRGIPVRKVTFIVYTICGAFAGLAGVLYASRYGFVNPGSAGTGFELIVIAAVVIGGTSLMGGRGTVIGSFFGVIIIAVLENGLAQIGAQDPVKRLATGAVIILAVVLDRYRHRSASI